MKEQVAVICRFCQGDCIRVGDGAFERIGRTGELWKCQDCGSVWLVKSRAMAMADDPRAGEAAQNTIERGE